MRKTLFISITAALLLCAVLCTAGCVNQPVTADTGKDIPDAAVSLSIAKTGSTYSIGDTLDVVFLNTVGGYPLNVIKNDSGVSIEKKTVSVKRGDKEIDGIKFTVTALKPGKQTFTIGFTGHPDNPESQVSFYDDSIIVADTGDSPLTPRGIVTVEINAGYDYPRPGDYYDISVRADSSTGAKWIADQVPGLIISEPVFIPDADSKTGTEGAYHWYVKSDTPGYYVFSANRMTEGSSGPDESFVLPVFVAKLAEMPETSA